MTRRSPRHQRRTTATQTVKVDRPVRTGGIAFPLQMPGHGLDGIGVTVARAVRESA